MGKDEPEKHGVAERLVAKREGHWSEPLTAQKIDQKAQRREVKARLIFAAVVVAAAVGTWFVVTADEQEPERDRAAAVSSTPTPEPEATPTPEPEPSPTPDAQTGDDTPGNPAAERKLRRHLKVNFGTPGYETSWYDSIRGVMFVGADQVVVTTDLNPGDDSATHLCGAVLSFDPRRLQVAVEDTDGNHLHTCPPQ